MLARLNMDPRFRGDDGCGDDGRSPTALTPEPFTALCFLPSAFRQFAALRFLSKSHSRRGLEGERGGEETEGVELGGVGDDELDVLFG